LVCLGCAISPCTVANLEIIEANPILRALHHIRNTKLPPCLVHRNDDPSGIEQRDICGQRVEDSGLTRMQRVLRTPQRKRLAVTIRGRIYLASRHSFQAVPGLVASRNALGSRLSRAARG
ncbi:MAG: hypothetical protein JWN13_4519, partial [Betaproteobacteria bacterium]|nr:hypothetical protein [Betaproteobacteria bacterium]